VSRGPENMPIQSFEIGIPALAHKFSLKVVTNKNMPKRLKAIYELKKQVHKMSVKLTLNANPIRKLVPTMDWLHACVSLYF